MPPLSMPRAAPQGRLRQRSECRGIYLNALSTSTGTLGLTSATANLTVGDAGYSTVNINGSGNILFAKASTIGDGTGVVTISTSGNIDGGGQYPPSDRYDGQPDQYRWFNRQYSRTHHKCTDSCTQCHQSSVNAVDSVAATAVTGSASTSFTLTDSATSGTGIAVNSPISAATINLTTSGASDIVVNKALGSGSGTVNLSSGAIITLVAAATVSASTISLVAANNVTAGGTLTGNNITITATGGVATVSKRHQW